MTQGEKIDKILETVTNIKAQVRFQWAAIGLLGTGLVGLAGLVAKLWVKVLEMH